MAVSLCDQIEPRRIVRSEFPSDILSLVQHRFRRWDLILEALAGEVSLVISQHVLNGINRLAWMGCPALISAMTLLVLHLHSQCSLVWVQRQPALSSMRHNPRLLELRHGVIASPLMELRGDVSDVQKA